MLVRENKKLQGRCSRCMSARSPRTGAASGARRAMLREQMNDLAAEVVRPDGDARRPGFADRQGAWRRRARRGNDAGRKITSLADRVRALQKAAASRLIAYPAVKADAARSPRPPPRSGCRSPAPCAMRTVRRRAISCCGKPSPSVPRNSATRSGRATSRMSAVPPGDRAICSKPAPVEQRRRIASASGAMAKGTFSAAPTETRIALR